MAEALRSSVIELDWKINSNSLQKANDETDKLIAKSAQMEQNFNQGASAINSTTNSISKYSNAAQQGTNSVVQMGNKTQATFRGTNSAVQSSTNNVVQFGSKGTSAFSSVGSSANSAKSNVAGVTSALNNATNTAGSFGSKIKNSINVAKNNVFDLSKNFDGLSNTVTGVTGKISQSIESGVTKPLNIAKGILGGLLATAGVASAGSLFNAGIDRLSSIEDAKLSLDVMMGDSGKAQGFMNEILAFAKTTPYAFTQLSSSAKNLFAYGMDQNNIVPTLKAIGDLAAASGKGAGAIDTLSNAFGKMQVMGKVSTEQLNTITEAGVPALKILANEAGVTVEEMQKRISSGAIESGKAIATIVKGIQDGSKGIAGETQALGGVMEKLKGTWKGSLDSMKSSVTSTMATLIEPAKPHIQEGMAWFATQFKKLPDIVSEAGDLLSPAWEPTKQFFSDMQSFFSKTFIPSAKEVGRVLGPGIAEGAKNMFNVMDKGFKYIIKPSIRILKEFTDENPVAMKQVGKWATYGIGGLLGFKLVGKPLLGVSKGILGIIGKLEKLGNTAQREAFKTRKALEDVDSAAQKASAPTHTTASPNIQESLPVGSVGKIGKGTKLFGGVRRFAKSVPLLSYISAGLTLTQINKNNKFEKIGDSLGSIVGGALGAKAAALAGTKIGAVAGTTFGPIGTVIGGILGTAIGSAAGGKIGEVIKKHWPEISSSLGKLWDTYKKVPFYGQIAQAVESGIIDGAKSGKKLIEEVKEFFKKPFDNEVKPEKGVTKASAKRVNSYMDKYEEIINKDTEAQIEGRALTNEEISERYKTLDEMKDQVTGRLDYKKNKSAENIDKLTKSGILSTKDGESAKAIGSETAKVRTNMYTNKVQDFKELEKKEYDDVVKATERYTNRINEIKEKARLENRELSKSDTEEIKSNEISAAAATRIVQQQYADENKSIHEEMKRQAVGALSDSAKEQKIIMGNLKNTSGEISAQQAADAVAASYKAKEGTVKSANEKYEETKRILDEERYVNGTITQQQYDDALKKAQEQRDGVVKEAEKQHEDVVTQAKKQAEGHLEQVDWETGETLSKWEVFKKDSKKKFKEIWDGTVEGAKSFGKAFGEAMDKVVSGALETWDNFKTGLADKVNAVTGGINVVLDFLSIPKIPEWKPNTPNSTKNKHGRSFSTGSRGASYSGQALVGEEGVELAYNKSTSSMRLLGSNGPEVTNVTSGERILNHSDTKAVLNGGMGQGTVLPGFHKGKGNGLSDFVDSAKDFGANTVDKLKDFGSNAVDKAKEVGTKAIEKTKDIAETAKDWLSDPIGKVTGLFNKHNTYKKGKNIQGLGHGVMNKLKDTSAEWVKNKLEAFKVFFDSEDGGAFGSGAFAPHFGSPFVRTSDYGKRPGLYGDFHTGIDYAAPTGTPIPAQYPGLVDWVQSSSIGLGEHVGIKVADNLWAMYGHMSRIRAKMGDKVKAGQIVGDVGSSGWSTGPHVHYELRKGGPNGQHVNPDTYGGAAGGAAVGAAGWGPQVRKAAKLMNQGITDSQVNGILAQIQLESGGNQSAIQSLAVDDINARTGNLARGLLQYTPTTFEGFKVRGYENIMNGFHQLVAFFNNSNWQNDIQYGRSGWTPNGHRLRAYAKGGRPSKGETVLVGENGPELFEADTAGTVHPHEKTKALFNQGSPSVNFSPNITINVGNNSDKSVVGDIKEAVRQALEDEYAKLLNILGTGEVV
ncbi:TPA: peptidoglycan DD-metalloendopeptidase family protein [Enterococcus faecalis]|nr:peptidoglycan DD-metalloendopeptidase family protein [Enterococcus faecalis]